MAKIEKSTTINAPVEQVFSYVSDPMNETEWIPGFMDVKDVSGSGVGQHWRWTYKIAGMHLEGETTVTEHIPNERRVIQTKGGAVSTWTFTFETHDGVTKLDMDIEYTIPIPLLGKPAEKLVLRRNEREADLAMANIKDKLEG